MVYFGLRASSKKENGRVRLNEIVLGQRAITADTALRLARLFEMSP